MDVDISTEQAVSYSTRVCRCGADMRTATSGRGAAIWICPTCGTVKRR